MESKTITFIRATPLVSDSRVEKETVSLSNNGFNVKILGWDREGKYVKQENCYENIQINRFKLKAPYGRPNLVLYLFIWWIYEFYWLLTNRWDFVHACDFDTLIPALLVVKIKQKKIVYDIFDFYAETLPLQTPKAVRNIVAKIERFFLQFVDIVIIVDESRKKQVEGTKIRELVYIMNTPKDMITKLDKIDENRNFIIFYGGLLAEERGLHQIINATENLDDIKIVIAGFGRGEEELKLLFQKAKNVQFIGKIPYNDVLLETMKADLLFALYDPSVPNNRYASPNKIFEAMMCKKPIIVSDSSSMANIVKKVNCGIVVAYGDIDSIRNAVLKLKNNPQLRKYLGDNGRKAYEEKYNWEIMEKRLIGIYNDLTDVN